VPHGASGVLAALPFAIWFYLGIEGVANAAEEAREPQRDIAFGFGAALATLIGLALLVFVAAVGVAGWQAVVYAPGSSEPSDAPLPLALARVVGRDSALYALLLSVGLFGLVASFHGILLAAGRATLELGRAGFLPRILGRIHAASGTPRIALCVNMLLGVATILTGSTAEIITLSCFGALSLYVLSLSALFRLRHLEPALARPYRAPMYPWLAGSALAIALACMAALSVSQPRLLALFLGLNALAVLHYDVNIRRRTDGMVK
jgi:ethanolamine permease